VLAHTLIERGAFEEAMRALEMPDPEPWIKTVPYAMLLEARARIHIAAGDLDAAATDLEGAGELMMAMGAEQPFCPWRARLGFVRARQGDVDAGREQVEVGLAQARAADVPRPLGIALHARGLVDRMDGGDGLADLNGAVEALAGVGARSDHSRVLVDLGSSLLADDRREEARATLREAGDLARRIGADEVAERADYGLRRAGGRPSAGAVTRPGGLTGSELRVARLAAQGLTNAQIASELVVTPHTVRFHLGRAYRKLDVTGRDELPEALGGRP
jgi:DNA-binding CsgD family transcriptional regulator